MQNLCPTAIKTVGASLLAMAMCQALHVLDVPASSRAGSVPQGFAVDAGSVFSRSKLCDHIGFKIVTLTVTIHQ